jgi:hypothetical protein
VPFAPVLSEFSAIEMDSDIYESLISKGTIVHDKFEKFNEKEKKN